jgi:hypothetical protein
LNDIHEKKEINKMEKVVVKIDPKNQEVTYEVEGVMGGKCTDITKLLLANNEEVETQYTEEYCTPEVLPDYINNMEGDK